MVEKFGIRYAIRDVRNNYGIYEIFASVGDGEKTYESIGLAKEAFYSLIQERTESSKERLENKRIIYEKKVYAPGILNFLGTISGNKKKNLNMLDADLKEIESDRLKAIAMIEENKIEKLNENEIYNVEFPDLKKGDIIYLSVHKTNQVERGIYEIVINRINRHYGRFQFEGNIFREGSLKEYVRGFSDENGLRNDYTYHRFFLTREEAKSYYNNEIDKEVKELISFKIN